MQQWEHLKQVTVLLTFGLTMCVAIATVHPEWSLNVTASILTNTQYKLVCHIHVHVVPGSSTRILAVDLKIEFFFYIARNLRSELTHVFD